MSVRLNVSVSLTQMIPFLDLKSIMASPERYQHGRGSIYCNKGSSKQASGSIVRRLVGEEIAGLT